MVNNIEKHVNKTTKLENANKNLKMEIALSFIKSDLIEELDE